MEIEVATPEMQAELDSMSVEQLEQRVSQEEGAAPLPQGEATGQPTGEAKPEIKPQADPEPAWFTKYKEDNKRELGSLRSLASLKDQLPKLVQEQVNQRLAALQQAQNRANLSPEDQQAQEQLQTQQEAFEKFVQDKARAEAKAEFGEAAKPYLSYLDKLMEHEAETNFKADTLDSVKDLMPEGAEDAWNNLFKGIADDIEAGKPGAIERFDRLSTNKDAAAFAMIQMQRAQIQNQAQQVTKQRSDAGKQAAQGVKASAVQASGKKSVSEMSQAELDKLSVAELEAEIPQA